MAKLNQIIAVEKGIKSGTLRDLTDAHHGLQKPALLSGLTRTYQPKDEEGEQFPPESTRVQVKVGEEANGLEVTDQCVGDVVFRYLFE